MEVGGGAWLVLTICRCALTCDIPYVPCGMFCCALLLFVPSCRAAVVILFYAVDGSMKRLVFGTSLYLFDMVTSEPQLSNWKKRQLVWLFRKVCV